jgi:hypothetical protein
MFGDVPELIDWQRQDNKKPTRYPSSHPLIVRHRQIGFQPRERVFPVCGFGSPAAQAPALAVRIRARCPREPGKATCSGNGSAARLRLGKAAQPGSAHATSGRGPRDDGGDQPPLNYGVRRGPSEVVWATPSIRAGRRRGPIQTATRGGNSGLGGLFRYQARPEMRSTPASLALASWHIGGRAAALLGSLK